MPPSLAPIRGEPPLTPPPRSTWRLIFRIIRWTTYAAALITLLMIFHATPAPVIATSPQAAARLEEKIAAAEQSVASGNSATLRMDETELNSYLASHLELAAPAPSSNASNSAGASAPNATGSAANASSAGENAAAARAQSPDPTAGVSAPAGTPSQQIEQVRSTVRDVKVQLIEDRVRAYVVFDFHGKDLSLQLEGKLHSADGYLRFEPLSGQFGAFPIPQSALETAVQRLMDSPENREKFKLPPQMADLRVENGEVVATYR